ncbi:MAG: PD-(D/E)XK nuclease family protein [Candidatus Stygibacter australis]|nr:PD-(D/E)XK nuclease family protein [Candidatus Stygibacter australis]MDP8321593.1 PD-(D/E)XK nuclease family protein [Candidatus Stygibacter australis]
MPKLKFIDFDQNINEYVAAEYKSASTLFLCPNHASLKELKQEYQQYCSFNNSTFLTMDNFKMQCMDQSIPILKDEKRVLAFYAALKPAYREQFHLNSYFQSVTFAYDFFTFFDELAEEMKSIDEIPAILATNKTAQNWQEDTYNILLKIRDDYLQYIQQSNFIDPIFIKNIANVNTEWLDSFRYIVVLNQFYFTALEKELLPDANTIIYLQIPEEIYDKNKLSCLPEFNASHLSKYRTTSIYNHIYSDEFSLKRALFEKLDAIESDLIIDFGLMQQHLDKYDCRHLLGGNNSIEFSHSSLFQLLEQFHALLAGIIYKDSRYLLTVNSLISSFSNNNFIKPFLLHCYPDLENDQIIQYQEKLLNFIYYLADLDYKYFPLSGYIPNISVDPELKTIFSKLKLILDNFSSIATIDNIISAITSSDFILPDEIITPHENQYTDLIEVYYNLLEDFASLDIIDLISDWNNVFPLMSYNGYYSGSQFLRLFLEFAKSKTYRYSTSQPSSTPVHYSSLHNTRNLQFDNIAIIDTIEGVIPPTRQTPFLLNEAQRKSLGLKTFQDILLREKYYFFRIIAQAKNVHCFSRTNLEDRTEISSFLEELRLKLPELFRQDPITQSALYQDHCRSLLPPVKQDSTAPTIPDNFLSLPFRKKSDLKDGNFYLSPSNIQKVIEQPFNYYLDNMLYLKKRELEIEMDYSPTQIGNLVHQAFNDMWERIIEIKAAQKGQQPFMYNQENYASRALDHLLMNNPQIMLQKPHNYSDLYFVKVIKPLIHNSLINFLQLCDEKYSGIAINIIPEKPGNNQQKQLMEINGIPVILKGRADLRIELSSTRQNHIYDYKSGKHNSSNKETYNTQLIMYEHLYYSDDDQVQSWLYFTTDQKLEPVNLKNISKAEYYNSKLDALKSALKTIFDSYFLPGEKKDPYEDDDISRKQLLKLHRSKA